ncbi:hypothetical protein TYRP_015401 [Tyrophagus putrescentiae]|nr:hypothetical protein TYRP_015401 [Tyrophagus putrescentiae]
MPSLLLWDTENGGVGSKIKRRCVLLLPLKSVTSVFSSPTSSAHHPPLHHLLLIVLFALVCSILAFFATFAIVDVYNRGAIENHFSAEAFCAAYGDCLDCQAEIAPNFRRYQQSYVAFFNRELERAQLDQGAKLVAPGDLITPDGLKSIVRQFCRFTTVTPGPEVSRPVEARSLCKPQDRLCDRCVRYNVDCLNISPYYVMNPGSWTCNTPEEWAAIGVYPRTSVVEVKSNCSTMMSEQFDNSDNSWNFDLPTSVKIDYDAVL